MPFDIYRADIHARLNKVLVWVSDQCGAENDVNAIQDTITIIDQQASKLARTV